MVIRSQKGDQRGSPYGLVESAGAPQIQGFYWSLVRGGGGLFPFGGGVTGE